MLVVEFDPFTNSEKTNPQPYQSHLPHADQWIMLSMTEYSVKQSEQVLVTEFKSL